jgi:hypothetical protein
MRYLGQLHHDVRLALRTLGRRSLLIIVAVLITATAL